MKTEYKMTAKEFLEQGLQIERNVESLYSVLEYWRGQALMCHGIDYSKERVQGGDRKTIEDYIDSILQAEDRIKQELDKLYKTKKEIQEMILEVKNNELKSILLQRYIEGKKWEEIIDDMHYSKKTMFRKHNKAIEIFSVVYKINLKKTPNDT